MTTGLAGARSSSCIAGIASLILAGCPDRRCPAAPARSSGIWHGRHRRRDDRRGAHRARPLPGGRGRSVRRRRPVPAAASPPVTPLEPRFRRDRARSSSTRRRAHRMRVWLDPDRASDGIARRTDGSRLRQPGSRVGRAILARPGPRTGRPRTRSPKRRWPRSNLAHPPAPRPVAPRRPRRRHAPKAPSRTSTASSSWLDFNARVLHEARDERNPLLERVKFLAIFAGNLDEFFQVRIAGLRQQVEAGKVARSPDGRTAEEQLAAARAARARARRRPFGDLVDGPAGARRRRHRARRLRRDPRAPRGAPPALLRRDLPGPDAARGRSRATRSRTSRR